MQSLSNIAKTGMKAGTLNTVTTQIQNLTIHYISDHIQSPGSSSVDLFYGLVDNRFLRYCFCIYIFKPKSQLLLSMDRGMRKARTEKTCSRDGQRYPAVSSKLTLLHFSHAANSNPCLGFGLQFLTAILGVIILCLFS